MTLFVIANGYGWGMGESLTEAMKTYAKYNGSIPKGQKYQLQTFELGSINDLDMSNPFEYVCRNGARLLSQTIETK